MESSYLPEALDAPADMLSQLTQLYAENIGLQSKLHLLECQLNTEHDTLKRMQDIDPSLPISLLASILAIARRKQEDNTSLASSQGLHKDALERLDCIRDREDWLMAAASASDGPTFFGHSRRWQSLRTERAKAEGELRSRIQHITLIRERLAKLEVLEKQAWGALTINANRPRTSRSSNRPTSRKSGSVSTIGSNALTPITVNRNTPDSSMTENGNPSSIDSANLPEIPDSPTIAGFSTSAQQPPVATLSSQTLRNQTLPIISEPVRSNTPRIPQSTLAPFSAMVAQSRKSTTSSMLTSTYSHSSIADTASGPLTPFTSYSDLPGTHNYSENSTSRPSERDPSKRHGPRTSPPPPPPPPSSSKRYEAGRAPKTERPDHTHIAGKDQASNMFEFTPFNMAPLVITPFPALNDVPFPSSPATVPSSGSRPASNVKIQSRREAEGRDNSSQSTIRKLVRHGIFRGSASGAGSIHGVTERTPNASPADIENRVTNAVRPKSRLEPLVESWVLEQMGAPPPSPSSREIAAYYSENDAVDNWRLPRPFTGRLKPSVGSWLGGRPR